MHRGNLAPAIYCLPHILHILRHRRRHWSIESFSDFFSLGPGNLWSVGVICPSILSPASVSGGICPRCAPAARRCWCPTQFRSLCGVFPAGKIDTAHTYYVQHPKASDANGAMRDCFSLQGDAASIARSPTTRPAAGECQRQSEQGWIRRKKRRRQRPYPSGRPELLGSQHMSRCEAVIGIGGNRRVVIIARPPASFCRCSRFCFRNRHGEKLY